MKKKKTRSEKLLKVYQDNEKYMYIWNLYKSRIPKITPIKLAKKVFGDWAVLDRADWFTGICTCVTC